MPEAHHTLPVLPECTAAHHRHVQLTEPPAVGETVYVACCTLVPWEVTYVEHMTGMVTLENTDLGATIRPAAVHFHGLYIDPPTVSLARINHTPEPGPIWTNGAADEPLRCPSWCSNRLHDNAVFTPNSSAHEHELLSLAALDENLLEDVPVRVLLHQDADEKAGRIHLEVGHALYQPGRVVFSRSDAARIAAAFITGNVMLVNE